jgi:hypothetical protein
MNTCALSVLLQFMASHYPLVSSNLLMLSLTLVNRLTLPLALPVYILTPLLSYDATMFKSD